MRLQDVQLLPPLVCEGAKGNVSSPECSPITGNYSRSDGGIWGGHNWRNLGARRGADDWFTRSDAVRSIKTTTRVSGSANTTRSSGRSVAGRRRSKFYPIDRKFACDESARVVIA